MKRKSKSILKSIMTVVLTVAMVLGAVPLPGGVLTVRAEGGTVAEIEIANWAGSPQGPVLIIGQLTGPFLYL